MLDKNILNQCQSMLVELKTQLLNRIHENRLRFHTSYFGGDEADQTQAVLEENALIENQGRMVQQLYEIEVALAKIESGRYGICEETQEFIEIPRLLKMPWTRFSLEGAELQEAQTRRYR